MKELIFSKLIGFVSALLALLILYHFNASAFLSGFISALVYKDIADESLKYFKRHY